MRMCIRTSEESNRVSLNTGFMMEKMKPQEKRVVVIIMIILFHTPYCTAVYQSCRIEITRQEPISHVVVLNTNLSSNLVFDQ